MATEPSRDLNLADRPVSLPSTDVKTLISQIHELREQINAQREQLTSIGYSNDASEMIASIAESTAESRSLILLKALSLYEGAVDAAAEGNRLAFLNRDDVIIREVRGVGSPRPRYAESATKSNSPIEVGQS